MKLLLLPGMQGTVDLFVDFAAALPSEFAEQAIGFPNDIPLSYPQLLDLVGSRAPSQPYVVVAESFSTPIAIQFAATNPPNLKGLVLSGGFATSPVRGILRFLTPFLAPLLVHIPVNQIGARLMLLGSTASEPLQARIEAAIASVSPKILMDRVQAVVACNSLEELHRIKVPILYLQARYDRLVDPICLEEIRRAKPEVEVEVLDSSHMLLQQLPQQTAQLVTDFVRRL